MSTGDNHLESSSENEQQQDSQATAEAKVLIQRLEQSRAFKKLKPGEAAELVSIAQSTIIEQHKLHIGPIPDPDSLAQYNEIIPNGAERIMAMAEKQSNHRMSLEDRVVKGGVNRGYIGQGCALVIALFFGYLAHDLADQGHEVVPGIMVGGTLVSIVAVFVIGRRSKK